MLSLSVLACKKDSVVISPTTTTVPQNANATFYNFTGTMGGFQSSAILSSDNQIVSCGTTNYKPFYLKLNKSGVQTWRKEYDFGFQGKLFSVTEASTHDLFFCGYTTVNANSQFLLVKTNSAGDTIWSKTYGTSESDFGYQIISTNDNNLLLCGITNKTQDSHSDIYLIKVNLNGDTLWTKSYTDIEQEVSFNLTETQTGDYLITGTNEDNGMLGRQVLILKVNANGVKQWLKKLALPDWYWGYATTWLSNGDLLICGKHSINGYSQMLFIKTDANGNVYWTKEFGEANLNEAAYAIQKNADGTLAVTGLADNKYTNTTDLFLLKLDNNGNQLFFKSYPNNTSGFGFSLLKDTNDDNIICGGNFDGQSMFFTMLDKDGNPK